MSVLVLCVDGLGKRKELVGLYIVGREVKKPLAQVKAEKRVHGFWIIKATVRFFRSWFLKIRARWRCFLRRIDIIRLFRFEGKWE